MNLALIENDLALAKNESLFLSTPTNDDVFSLLDFDPLVRENKWRRVELNIESDLKNMSDETVVDYFLRSWVYIHLLHIDSKIVFNLLKKKLLSYDIVYQKKLLYSNSRLCKQLSNTQNWVNFLFELFISSEKKLDIPPQFHVLLMSIDEERYFSILSREKELINKIQKSTWWSKYSEIKKRFAWYWL